MRHLPLHDPYRSVITRADIRTFGVHFTARIDLSMQSSPPSQHHE
jgi:hypothetical protein